MPGNGRDQRPTPDERGAPEQIVHVKRGLVCRGRTGGLAGPFDGIRNPDDFGEERFRQKVLARAAECVIIARWVEDLDACFAEVEAGVGKLGHVLCVA
jgi:hypothetical protein